MLKISSNPDPQICSRQLIAVTILLIKKFTLNTAFINLIIKNQKEKVFIQMEGQHISIIIKQQLSALTYPVVNLQKVSEPSQHCNKSIAKTMKIKPLMKRNK